MPKQIQLGERSGGPHGTPLDCPECGERMEQILRKGDFLPYVCPACGYRCQYRGLQLHTEDHNSNGLSHESFLGIGGDSLKKLLSVLLVLLSTACQGPQHEMRLQALEDTIAVMNTKITILQKEARRGRIEESPQMRRLPGRWKDSKQLFVMSRLPEATETFSGNSQSSCPSGNPTGRTPSLVTGSIRVAPVGDSESSTIRPRKD